MRIWKAMVLLIVALYELSRWAQELPGDPSSMNLERNSKSPKGEKALREESRDGLPQHVYDTFGRAVAHHRRKRYTEALVEYRKLRRISLRGGRRYDLFKHSGVFRYNWRLLAKTMKRGQTT